MMRLCERPRRFATAGFAAHSARLFAGNLRVHLAAFFQPVHAHGDHRVARLQAGGDLGLVAFGGAHRDRTHAHGLIRLHQPHIGALRVALDGGVGQQRNVLFLLHQQPRIHELAGEQLAVRIGENSAQL